MKKTIFGAIAACGLALFAACSNAQSTATGDEVLSVAQLDVGGLLVSLPTTRSADGVVCVSYAQSVSRDANGVVSAEVGKFCGKGDTAPANLVAMRVFEQNGLRIQVLDSKVARG